MSEGFVALKDSVDWNKEESSESEDDFKPTWNQSWDAPKVNLAEVQEEQKEEDDDFPEVIEEKKEAPQEPHIYSAPRRLTIKRKTLEEKLEEAAESGCPTLFVGNLHRDTTEEDLYQFFEKGGNVRVREVRIRHKNSHNQRSPRVFAYVEVESMDDLKKGLEANNHELHKGYPLNIDVAENPQRGRQGRYNRRGGDRRERPKYQSRFDSNFGPSGRNPRDFKMRTESRPERPTERRERNVEKQKEDIFGGAKPVVPKYKSKISRKNDFRSDRQDVEEADSWRTSKQSKQTKAKVKFAGLRGGKRGGVPRNPRQNKPVKTEQTREEGGAFDTNNLYACLTESE